MNDFDFKLAKYASLMVKVGVNIQPGQTLVVSAPVDAAYFVRAVAGQAYGAGAAHVHVEWSDDEVTRLQLLHDAEQWLAKYPEWMAQGSEQLSLEGAAFLYISMPNPDVFKDVDPGRIATATKARSVAMNTSNQRMRTGKVSWCKVAIPSPEWAQKVFPELPQEQAVDQLWDYVFRATRVDTDDPVAAWQAHTKNLSDRLEYLNGKQFKKLHYTGPGTSLRITLPEKHLWVGGGLHNENGAFFVPNMPTEEVFTAPKKDGVDGTVRSTKPLNYGGTIIDEFSITFEQGKIVHIEAERGYETLARLTETDEGALFLGEMALVPDNSPISRLNVTFSNTLFDENASCHFAIGSAYPLCVEGGTGMTRQELGEAGLNTSLVHVDFMVGSEALDIDGETADGSREPIFRGGNWVD